MTGLLVRIDRQDDVVRVTVEGELDLASAADLLEHTAAVADGEPVARVALDLGGLRFLDSSGLGALLDLRRTVTDRGGRLVIEEIAAAPLRVITLAGLADTFGVTGLR